MKDYTLIANNENQTKITFAYDHGLPFKPSIQPNIEYGIWDDDKNKILIKVFFNEKNFSFFKDKKTILGTAIYTINNEYWIDLENVYLIIPKDNKLEEKLQSKNLIIAFLFNDKLINAISL